jgi:hypothetical protein
MKAQYLNLTDGRKVRLEWNWNSVNTWTDSTGKELTDLADGKAKTSDMLSVVYNAALEGEDADGKELGLSEKEFGRLVNMQGIIDASKIISEQSATMAEKKSEAPRRSPSIFFRNKG